MSRHKREFPRISRELLAEVHCPGHGIFHVTAVNLSRAGLQLACDDVTARKIATPDAAGSPGRLPDLRVRVTLSLPGLDSEVVEARCHAVFTRRISEHAYRVGLSFREFVGEGYAQVDRFIDECIGRGI